MDPRRRRVLFLAAGAASIAGALALINAALPMTPIAATRHLSGIAVLALGGAAGGWAYLAARGDARVS